MSEQLTSFQRMARSYQEHIFFNQYWTTVLGDNDNDLNNDNDAITNVTMVHGEKTLRIPHARACSVKIGKEISSLLHVGNGVNSVSVLVWCPHNYWYFTCVYSFVVKRHLHRGWTLFRFYVRPEVFHGVSLMYDKCSSGISRMYDKCSSGICLMYEPIRT